MSFTKSFLFLAAIFFVTSSAHAAIGVGRFDIKAGLGMKDGYNFGLGGRVGMGAESGLYFGGSADYFFGTNSVSSLFFGAEAGYNISSATSFSLRPYIGVGVASISYSMSYIGSNSSSKFAF